MLSDLLPLYASGRISEAFRRSQAAFTSAIAVPVLTLSQDICTLIVALFQSDNVEGKYPTYSPIALNPVVSDFHFRHSHIP